MKILTTMAIITTKRSVKFKIITEHLMDVPSFCVLKYRFVICFWVVVRVHCSQAVVLTEQDFRKGKKTRVLIKPVISDQES